MRIHIVACRVFTRELSALIYKSPNSIAVTWLPQGLHNTPKVLHSVLEKTLEDIYRQIESKQLYPSPDCIVLGYGLCSNSTVGLSARDIPLVVPRTDDCIALFLGSQERYLRYFSQYSGTFWVNNEWAENSPDLDPGYLERYRKELEEKYEGDEDTVEYLLGIEREFIKNYRRIGFIHSQVTELPAARDRAVEFAHANSLEFMDVEGDNGMLCKVVDGDFDERGFLIVPPGHTVKYSDGPERMVAVPLR